MITDLHYADKPARGNRFYVDTIQKLRDAVRVFNEEKPDFVIELGDFKDNGVNREQTLLYLDTIETEYRKFRGAHYHVLGNHDVDNISKSDFLKHTGNHGQAGNKTWYSFVEKNIRFIILDANHDEKGRNHENGEFDWTKPYVLPGEQLEWLSAELGKGEPAVVFLHQLLDLTKKDKGYCVVNARDVIDILERRGNVIAVFQGHHHAGGYLYANGIHYYTLKGMIEGPYPTSNSFALVEIDASLNISIRGFKNCGDNFLRRRSDTYIN